jgi:hypothetical protein
MVPAYGRAEATPNDRGYSTLTAMGTMSTRTIRLIAVGYVVKTALVGLAWLAIPDLPERALAMARQTWSRVTSSDTASR